MQNDPPLGSAIRFYGDFFRGHVQRDIKSDKHIALSGFMCFLCWESNKNAI